MYEKIWLVWNPNGRAPSYIHNSEESAKAEAKRLARINSGHNFYVLESVGVAVKNDVSFFATERVGQRQFTDDDLPF